MYRNKLSRALSQSNDPSAKRTCRSQDVDRGVAHAPNKIDEVDISDLVSRDEPPTESEDESGISRCSYCRPANDFPYSLAQWVKYRNKWVLIPDWHFRTDAQHVPECRCRFCEILKTVCSEKQN